jgi:hypothetical protein
MIRKNEDRTGPRSTAADEIPADLKQMLNPMDFVAPTDFVELPSKGQFYPEGHPLCGKDTIEIKYMTAKEEDILSSRALIKKGVAIERVLESIIKDKSINASDLLIGDRNAILIKARSSAYGHMYKANVNCPACGAQNKKAFNLLEPKVSHGDNPEDHGVEKLENGRYKYELPFCKLFIEFRMLNGKDEAKLIKIVQQDSKKESHAMSQQIASVIQSVNGYEERNVIDYFVLNMLAGDARAFRKILKALTPDLRISSHFTCTSCDHEQELEVPFGADFFWPDRGI